MFPLNGSENFTFDRNLLSLAISGYGMVRSVQQIDTRVWTESCIAAGEIRNAEGSLLHFSNLLPSGESAYTSPAKRSHI